MKLRISWLALVLLLAACGSDDGRTDETTVAPETTAVTATEAPASETTAAPETTATTMTEAPAATATVTVAATDLGDILVDGSGNVLYMFMPDEQGASVCYDECANNWPPLVGEVGAGDGIDGSLLGSVARDDGSEQVTYNGWPLYYFAADAEPGDTNGQGINDVWFVLSATGEAIS